MLYDFAPSICRTRHGWTKADTDGKEWAHQPIIQTGDQIISNLLHPHPHTAGNTSQSSYNSEVYPIPTQIDTEQTTNLPLLTQHYTVSSVPAPQIRDKQLPGTSGYIIMK